MWTTNESREHEFASPQPSGALRSSAIVHVIDDDSAHRRALSALVRSGGWSVVSYASATEFLGRYRDDHAGCMIVDVCMPGMSGLQLVEELKRREVALPIIVVTGYADVASAIRAIKGGAYDYFEKPLSNAPLLERVSAAVEWHERARGASTTRVDARHRFTGLTERERGIVRLIAEGKPNKQIADELGLSIRTVEGHRRRAMAKIEATTVADLVRFLLSAELDH